MTSLPTSYTPLESLLLFNALRVEGITAPTFSRISEQLKSVPLIRSDPTYDADRLSPDALRQLYLDLLKDEVKWDLQRQLDNDTALVNGDSLPTSRKRKAASPTLPSIHDAAQHSHLIPQLVARLYKRYRDITVEELREYERKHASLSRQMTALEIGNGNGVSQKQDLTPISSSSSPSPINKPQPGKGLGQYDHARPASSHSNGVTTPHDLDSEVIPKSVSQAKIDAATKYPTETQQSPSAEHRRTSPNAPLPPLSDVAPQSPRSAYPPKEPSAVSPAHLTQGNAASYAPSPSRSQQASYSSQAGHATVANPQMQSSMSRSSSSPQPILPPLSNTQSSQSPVNHAIPPNVHATQAPTQTHFQQVQRAAMVTSPNHENSPRGYHQPSHAGYYHAQAQNHPDRRTSFPAHQSLPPGPYTPQPQPPHSSAYSQGGHGYPHYPLAPATAPRPMLQPSARLLPGIVAALATPPRSSQRELLWSWERRPVPTTRPSSPKRPEVEPMSPITSHKSLSSAARFTRNTKDERHDQQEPKTAPGVDSTSTPASSSAPVAASEPKKGRRRQIRNKSPHSVASSVADRSTRARTRSESVSTVTGVTLQPDKASSGRNQVKNEPSTPLEMGGDNEAVPEPSATPSGRMTRQRRGTLQSQPSHTTSRKRRPSPATADDKAEDMASPPPRSTTITAYRGFDRTSATLVENIGSHKHAVYFQGAVRNKNAQGYSDIIKRPQHLKGIKSALSAGRRAVAAAASADHGNVMELERSLEIMPPKAIVNATQLEKEVMRTMANAAMFNPGEDGLVADTREMFEDVEAMFTDWRGAEQETAGNGSGVGVGGGDEDEGRGKRRKL
nr:hypothetical protein CFP56_69324 [Quercus suber]